MILVDAKYRGFFWASVGFPGNSHDSVILQSTRIWKDITENNIIPSISRSIGGEEVGPVIVADSAFPCTNWIMKPSTHLLHFHQKKKTLTIDCRALEW